MEKDCGSGKTGLIEARNCRRVGQRLEGNCFGNGALTIREGSSNIISSLLIFLGSEIYQLSSLKNG